MTPVYKFKGKNINGDWVIGLLSISQGVGSQPPIGWYISNSSGMPWAYHVRSETVTPYVQITDINGRELYLGDVVKDKYGRTLQIVFHSCRYMWEALEETNFRYSDFFDWLKWNEEHELTNIAEVTYIGNAFDNLEIINNGTN